MDTMEKIIAFAFICLSLYALVMCAIGIKVLLYGVM